MSGDPIPTLALSFDSDLHLLRPLQISLGHFSQEFQKWQNDSVGMQDGSPMSGDPIPTLTLSFNPDLHTKVVVIVTHSIGVTKGAIKKRMMVQQKMNHWTHTRRSGMKGKILHQSRRMRNHPQEAAGNSSQESDNESEEYVLEPYESYGDDDNDSEIVYLRSMYSYADALDAIFQDKDDATTGIADELLALIGSSGPLEEGERRNHPVAPQGVRIPHEQTDCRNMDWMVGWDDYERSSVPARPVTTDEDLPLQTVLASASTEAMKEFDCEIPSGAQRKFRRAWYGQLYGLSKNFSDKLFAAIMDFMESKDGFLVPRSHLNARAINEEKADRLTLWNNRMGFTFFHNLEFNMVDGCQR
ncbi:hypothetical protein BJ138DRAFT_1106619 [Hygrophoropsis aurantiaca]|uniref:Uncharacterized protein n=1 Tax=Hygrophoropsis aurantiaca TaxID=72124 RepID=A0ACB7ZV58_9AGAM|nr:hypothetical protein BJ138DRAFT_1106619 [Hygrophoropsis aurantiaca]